MSANVLLNLSKVLGEKRSNARHAKHLSIFRKEFNKFNKTGARMLVSIYHRTLKLRKNRFFDVNTSIFSHLLRNVIMAVIK